MLVLVFVLDCRTESENPDIFITAYVNACSEQESPRPEACLVVVSWHISYILAEASRLARNHEHSSLPQDNTSQDMGGKDTCVPLIRCEFEK